ncbi:hypothetical protein LEP1GSC151_0072 [Leptospira interrogans serovar Grippotyphosa str. LT2186]|uniref:Uncharacterized protein n=1 Tax=Leptospira interrogans serovar Grippotyphosa str. LT2186 TaxID=1001599 RepID=M3HHV0_LEPIR|nr:hypothetical protein LEP1GSC151_0072 [Leptospira interrogans serovar Grippotyphosa str. LT2186]
MPIEICNELCSGIVKGGREWLIQFSDNILESRKESNNLQVLSMVFIK